MSQASAIPSTKTLVVDSVDGIAEAGLEWTLNCLSNGDCLSISRSVRPDQAKVKAARKGASIAT